MVWTLDFWLVGPDLRVVDLGAVHVWHVASLASLHINVAGDNRLLILLAFSSEFTTGSGSSRVETSSK